MTEPDQPPPSNHGRHDGEPDQRRPSDRVAELLLVATPFLLLALFLFLEWWLRS